MRFHGHSRPGSAGIGQITVARPFRGRVTTARTDPLKAPFRKALTHLIRPDSPYVAQVRFGHRFRRPTNSYTLQKSHTAPSSGGYCWTTAVSRPDRLSDKHSGFLRRRRRVPCAKAAWSRLPPDDADLSAATRPVPSEFDQGGGALRLRRGGPLAMVLTTDPHVDAINRQHPSPIGSVHRPEPRLASVLNGKSLRLALRRD